MQSLSTVQLSPFIFLFVMLDWSLLFAFILRSIFYLLFQWKSFPKIGEIFRGTLIFTDWLFSHLFSYFFLSCLLLFKSLLDWCSPRIRLEGRRGWGGRWMEMSLTFLLFHVPRKSFWMTHFICRFRGELERLSFVVSSWDLVSIPSAAAASIDQMMASVVWSPLVLDSLVSCPCLNNRVRVLKVSLHLQSAIKGE